MTYRAAPVTQRDGSALASSNCRMASIATGLDYESLGAQTSTGAKMRSYTGDQSGGTDSGDARESWDRGYGAVLRVRDGYTFDDALADLEAGRLVHLDVWHASVGGPCLSGTGAYGHTIAVAPEELDGSWLVADPWCNPPSWKWVTESKLRAGAERWGSEVYSAAALEADYPTGGAPRDPNVLEVVERIVRRLMTRWYPGHELEAGGIEPETGGGGPILYTTTHTPEEDEMSGPLFSPAETIGVATVKVEGANMIGTSDGKFHPVPMGYVRNVAGVVTMTDPYAGERAYVVSVGGGASGLLLADHVTYVPEEPPDDGDDLDTRKAQYDADATALLGPRPE